MIISTLIVLFIIKVSKKAIFSTPSQIHLNFFHGNKNFEKCQIVGKHSFQSFFGQFLNDWLSTTQFSKNWRIYDYWCLNFNTVWELSDDQLCSNKLFRDKRLTCSQLHWNFRISLYYFQKFQSTRMFCMVFVVPSQTRVTYLNFTFYLQIMLIVISKFKARRNNWSQIRIARNEH